jgi:hypothetical protein
VSSADVECLDSVGTGQGGWKEMLRSDFIHAVYIIVPPRYVGYAQHYACCLNI